MKSLVSALLAGAAIVLAAPAFAASDVVTIYAADGLHDGKGSWFETQFDAFTKATGVKVQYVEAGSGGVVERVAKEKSNPQADVLVTLPPVHPARRGRRPAAEVQADRRPTRSTAATIPTSRWSTTTMNFIYNSAKLGRGAEDLRRPARSEVQGQDPVFDARPGRRRHGGHAAGHPRLRRARTPPSTISRSCRTTTSAPRPRPAS